MFGAHARNVKSYEHTIKDYIQELANISSIAIHSFNTLSLRLSELAMYAVCFFYVDFQSDIQNANANLLQPEGKIREA